MIELVMDLLPEPDNTFNGNRRPSKLPQKALFIVAVVVQLLVLGGLLAAKAYTLHSGKTVHLWAHPLRSSDIFDGDYVRLEYDISSTPSSDEFKEGQEVFVVLRMSDQVWQIARITKERPEHLTEDELYLNAKVESAGAEYHEGVRSCYRIRLRYGIERFFVAERSWENTAGKGPKMKVELAVDNFGSAVIKRILVDGKQLRLD